MQEGYERNSMDPAKRIFYLVTCQNHKQKLHNNWLLNSSILLLLSVSFCSSTDTISPDKPIKDGELLVSKSKTYALGFFSPGKSTSRYVGIWHNNLPLQTVIWVANRDSPGPAWFTATFNPSSKECTRVWTHFLARQVFPAGLPGSTDNAAFVCLPNASANNIGFMQSIPGPFFSKKEDILLDCIDLKQETIDDIQKRNDLRMSGVNFTSFTPTLGVSQDFNTWWDEYYEHFHPSLEECMKRIVDPFVQEQDPSTKTKALALKEPLKYKQSSGKAIEVEVDEEDEEDEPPLQSKPAKKKSSKSGTAKVSISKKPAASKKKSAGSKRSTSSSQQESTKRKPQTAGTEVKSAKRRMILPESPSHSTPQTGSHMEKSDSEDSKETPTAEFTMEPRVKFAKTGMSEECTSRAPISVEEVDSSSTDKDSPEQANIDTSLPVQTIFPTTAPAAVEGIPEIQPEHDFEEVSAMEIDAAQTTLSTECEEINK